MSMKERHPYGGHVALQERLPKLFRLEHYRGIFVYVLYKEDAPVTTGLEERVQLEVLMVDILLHTIAIMHQHMTCIEKVIRKFYGKTRIDYLN